MTLTAYLTLVSVALGAGIAFNRLAKQMRPCWERGFVQGSAWGYLIGAALMAAFTDLAK